MSRICIIPARGGSKRIPRKNVKQFHGRPMLAYAIAAAREAAIFTDIVVSTDDEEIATLAYFNAANVVKRPPELANDHATTAQVMKHALEERMAHGQARAEGDQVCCLYPCTPFVEARDLRDGLNTLIDSGKCYVLPIAKMQIQRALRVDENGVHPVWPNFADVRSQDLEPRWRDAGQWYWGWSEAWLKQIPIYYPTSHGLPVPASRAIDIDEPADWELAELLYAGMQSMRRPK